MNEPISSNADPSEKEKSLAVVPRKRSGWLPVIVLACVFLIGFGPMWLKSSRLNGELFRAQRQSRVEQIQIIFANAALDARRGEYESARQGMTSFFSLVTARRSLVIGFEVSLVNKSTVMNVQVSPLDSQSDFPIVGLPCATSGTVSEARQRARN